MPSFEQTSTFNYSVQELFNWHAREGAFQRLAPPWTPIKLEHFEGIKDGNRAIIRLGRPPAAIRWVAEHQDYEMGRKFVDVQIKGPFKAWRHEHLMEPAGSAQSTLTDAITYRLPTGKLGDLLAGGLLDKQLTRQFSYRHRITNQDLGLHARLNSDKKVLRIAITGSSGLIGRNLTALLTTGGHEVIPMTRHQTKKGIYWSYEQDEIEKEKLEGVDAVIHLAGEPVFAPRWSAAKKKRIYDSRINSTHLIANALANLKNPPGVFLVASAIGYYGNRGSAEVTEEDTCDPLSFLSRVCKDWEAAALPARNAGIRTAFLRIGLVLSPQGGALPKMLPLFRAGLGGRLGPPSQYYSWIMLDDILGAIYFALLNNKVCGPINLTAPTPVTAEEFADVLGDVLRRPVWLPAPIKLIKVAMGEMAQETLLMSNRVKPAKLEENGYAFLYPELKAGLQHVLGLY